MQDQPKEDMFLTCSKNGNEATVFMQVSIESDTDNGDGTSTQVSTFECITCGETKEVTQTYKTCRKK